MANLSARFTLIDEMSAKLDRIAQSGRQALSQLDSVGDAINAAFDSQMQVSLDATSQSMTELATGADEAADAFGELDKVNKETGTGLDSLSDEADKTKESIDDLGDTTEKTRKQTEDYDEQNRKTTEGMKSLEQLLVSAGIVKGLEALGSAFVASVQDAIEFESALTGVYKTVDGTPEQLATIADEVMALSLVIPSTTTEIAAVAEAAGQLGIATDDVMEFTEVMINLGEATNLSSDEAASSLAKFANITKMSADNYENLGSTVVALGNNFATTEADIVAMSTRMASAGELAGLTESQILALAASLSSVGIEADAGGSSMSTLLSKMQLAVETGNESLVQFAAVSDMTVEEFKQQWGSSAVDALYAFIAGLNDTERNGASATAILDEMGITEIRLSNAVKSLASNHEGLGAAIELANSAWISNTALANEANTRYATLESKLTMTENAANKLSTAFGNKLTPIVGMFADAGASAMVWLSEAIEKYPSITALVTGLAVGTGAVAIALTGYTVATKVATAVTTAFGVASMTALWPLYLVAGAIGAVAGAAIWLSNSYDSAEKEYESLTTSSKIQYEELEKLNSEYERACELYGEHSQEAITLRGELNALQSEYERTKQTVEEFNAELQAISDRTVENLDSYDETISKIEDEGSVVLALAGRLEKLASSNDVSNATQTEMLAIIQELNKEMPGLNLSMDEFINNSENVIKAIENRAMAEINAEKSEAAFQAYKEQLDVQLEAENALTTAKENQRAAQERYNALMAKNVHDEQMQSDNYDDGKYWAEQYRKHNEDKEKAFYELREANELLADAEEIYNETSSAADGLLDEFMELSGISADVAEGCETVADGLGGVESQLQALANAYTEAYEAAVLSFEGQFGLFDVAKADMEATVVSAQNALDSQLNFWQTYADNVNVLRTVSAEDLGVTQENYNEIMAYAQSGTEEAAGFAASLAQAVNSGNTEAIAKLADTVGQVKVAREQAAGEIAAWQVDLDGETQEIISTLEKTVEKMDMSEQAAESGRSLMQGLIDGATSMLPRVQAAYASVGQAAIDAINAKMGGTTPAVVTTVETGEAYAEGTDNATPGWHLVGENGPELRYFEGGEVVYPADETSQILSRTENARFHTSETIESDEEHPEPGKGRGGEKTIRLEINGSGAIGVDKSTNEDTVVDILYTHLKPVLLSIVRQEIYEEGELAYDY